MTIINRKGLVLVDTSGNPLESAQANVRPEQRSGIPSIGGEWIEGVSLEKGATLNYYRLERAAERRAARIAYFTNGMVRGVVNLLLAHVVGDDLSYGKLDDPKAQKVLERFWAKNKLHRLAKRMYLEYLLDGESCVVIDNEAGRNEAAYVGLVDVDKSMTLESNTLEGMVRVTVPISAKEKRTYERGEFVWTANDALFNDVRGLSIIGPLVLPALAYVGLINARLRAQDLLGRINGIYKALYYSQHEEGRVAADTAFKLKKDRWRNIPKDGVIVTIAKDADTGQEEEFELTAAGAGSSTSGADDARLIRMFAAFIFNLPPTWLGDGEDSNRASATVMEGPPLMAMKDRQAVFRDMITDVVRMELRRVFGEDATYMVRYTETEYDREGMPVKVHRKTKRVSVEELEIPINLPRLDDEALDAILDKVELMEAQGLASVMTRQEMLGLDVALEEERLAREGKTAGQKPEPTNPDGTPKQIENPGDDSGDNGETPEEEEPENDDQQEGDSRGVRTPARRQPSRRRDAPTNRGNQGRAKR